MYVDSLWPDVTQGDVFIDLLYKFVYTDESGESIIESRPISAVLITSSCQYDKPDSAWVYIAEIRPLNELSIANQGHVKSRRLNRAFFLEQSPSGLSASYIDFRRIYRFSKAYIALKASNGKRILSLTDEAQLALQHQLSLFFGLPRDTKSITDN
jgi:hypothetical protein